MTFFSKKFLSRQAIAAWIGLAAILAVGVLWWGFFRRLGADPVPCVGSLENSKSSWMPFPKEAGPIRAVSRRSLRDFLGAQTSAADILLAAPQTLAYLEKLIRDHDQRSWDQGGGSPIAWMSLAPMGAVPVGYTRPDGEIQVLHLPLAKTSSVRASRGLLRDNPSLSKATYNVFKKTLSLHAQVSRKDLEKIRFQDVRLENLPDGFVLKLFLMDPTLIPIPVLRQMQQINLEARPVLSLAWRQFFHDPALDKGTVSLGPAQRRLFAQAMAGAAKRLWTPEEKKIVLETPFLLWPQGALDGALSHPIGLLPLAFARIVLKRLPLTEFRFQNSFFLSSAMPLSTQKLLVTKPLGAMSAEEWVQVREALWRGGDMPVALRFVMAELDAQHQLCPPPNAVLMDVSSRQKEPAEIPCRKDFF